MHHNVHKVTEVDLNQSANVRLRKNLVIGIGLCQCVQLGENGIVQALTKRFQNMFKLLKGNVSVASHVKHRERLNNFLLCRAILR